jgi:hypothetical protein
MPYLIFKERKQIKNKQNYYIGITFYYQSLFQTFSRAVYSASITVSYFIEKNKINNKIKSKFFFWTSKINKKQSDLWLYKWKLKKKIKFLFNYTIRRKLSSYQTCVLL